MNVCTKKTVNMLDDPTPSSRQGAREEEVAAKAAGWRRVDLTWERLQEQGCQAMILDEHATAIHCFSRARWLALWRFQRSDARFATSLANAAMAARLTGRNHRAQWLYFKALHRWEAIPARIISTDPATRVQWSLFPLRLGPGKSEVYPEGQLERLAGFVAEADEVLRALAAHHRPPHCPFERWVDEKPDDFDDVRKLVAAALLIAT